MSRVNFAETEEQTFQKIDLSAVEQELQLIIPQYARHKELLDDYKKTCDAENDKIKLLLLSADRKDYKTGGYKATRTEVNKEIMDEIALLSVLHKYGITDAIKTKEYVDMDALENYLYNATICPELAADIDKCRKTSTSIRLTITKIKEKNNG